MGVVWVRVCAAALAVLSEVIVRVGREKDGGNLVGRVFEDVLEQEGNREKAIWQPAKWYNGSITSPSSDGLALFTQPWTATHLELLVWLEDSLEVLQQEALKPKKPYPEDKAIRVFWRSVGEARRVLQETEDRGHTVERGEWSDLVREIRELVELRAWETEVIDARGC
ncbi:hypothetical protein IAQ61_005056 [Plenodomus lingam]|nr:hypothetical protein IAQ61_005056 [Plenodomus lingam]